MLLPAFTGQKHCNKRMRFGALCGLSRLSSSFYTKTSSFVDGAKVEWLLHKSGPKIKIKESDDNSTSSTLVSSGGWRGGEVGEKNSICIFVPPTPTPSCKHSRDTDASLAFRPLLFMCYVVVCR